MLDVFLFILIQLSFVKHERHRNLGAVVTAVLNDSLHLFMYELHTPQTGIL